MPKYKFLKHTADAKFQAFGKTLEEAFSSAALATVSLMWDWKIIENKLKLEFEVRGKDLEQLLVNFLEEILYLWDSQMFLVGKVEKIEIMSRDERYFLRARFSGDKYSDKYKIYGNVKAITYNEMEIKKNDHFMIQVVVDV